MRLGSRTRVRAGLCETTLHVTETFRGEHLLANRLISKQLGRMDRSVPLSRLVHDVVQASYKDLHATIDTLGDAEDAGRRERLLELALRVRHRIARLLVAVRWFMDFSAFHQSATTARDSSTMRSASYVHAADALWATAQMTKAAAAPAPSLDSAAEVLGGEALFRRLPRLIETAVGLDLEEPLFSENSISTLESDAVVRLGATTRNMVRLSLPRGTAVLAWRVGPGNAAVRIGISEVWTADVILESLHIEKARLRLLKLAVLVSADPDALGPMKTDTLPSDTALLHACRRLFTVDQEEALRQMIEDRMDWAVSNQLNGKAAAIREAGIVETVQPCNNSEPQSDIASRYKTMLAILSQTLSCDISVVFAMDHIRAQAATLPMHTAWRSCGIRVEGTSSQSKSDSPVIVWYWLHSFAPASITFLPMNKSLTTDASSENGRDGSLGYQEPTAVISVRHEPSILGASLPQLNLRAINVENIVISAADEHARHLMYEVAQHCSAVLPEARIEVEGGCSLLKTSLKVEFSRAAGVVLSISLKRGTWSISQYGLCMGDFHGEYPLWSGELQFPSLESLKKTVGDRLQQLSRYSVSCAIARNALALDMGATFHCPGLTSSVDSRPKDLEFEKPYLPLQQYKPSVFAFFLNDDQGTDEMNQLKESGEYHEAMSGSNSPAQRTSRAEKLPISGECEGQRVAKRPRTVLLRHSNADEVAFVQCKRSRVCASEDRAATFDDDYNDRQTDMSVLSAATMRTLYCICADERHRIRRDVLLHALRNRGIITSTEKVTDDFNTQTAMRTGLGIVAEPIPVLAAELLLGGDDSWEIQLTILTDILEDSSRLPGTVVYDSTRQELRFRYPAIRDDCVTCFCNDLVRARASVSLIQAVSANPSTIYKVQRRTPSYVQMSIGEFTIAVGLVWKGFRVIVNPTTSVLHHHLAPLVEEMLDEGEHLAGKILVVLMEHAFPLAVAIQQALPPDTASWRLRFSMCLKARILLRGASRNVTHALEVDSRPKGRVLLTDYARALSAAPPDAGVNPAGSAIHKQIPRWDVLVSRLTSNGAGHEMHSGSTVAVSMLALPKVLRAVVATVQRG